MFSSNGEYQVSEDGVVSGASIVLSSATLTDAQKAKFPHLADYPAFELPDLPEELSLSSLMKGSLIALASSDGAEGEPAALRSSTAVQYAGALDAIFAEAATDLEYGPIYGDDGVTFRLWAPTASEVELVVYNSDKSEASRHTMQEDSATGSWSVEVETDSVDRQQVLPLCDEGLPTKRAEGLQLRSDRPILCQPFYELFLQPSCGSRF